MAIPFLPQATLEEPMNCQGGACSNNQTGGITQYINQANQPTYEQIGSIDLTSNADGTFTRTATIKIKSDSLPINVGIAAIGPEVLGIDIVPLDMVINTIDNDWIVPGGFVKGLEGPFGRVQINAKVKHYSSDVNFEVTFNVGQK